MSTTKHFWVLLAAAAATTASTPLSPEERACTIWCDGPILTAVQSYSLYEDSKTFVDMPLRDSISPEEALATFQALVKSNHPAPLTKEALHRFVNSTFLPAGSDMVEWIPPDWQDRPPMLERIAKPAVQKWAASLNDLWKVLGRKPAPSVAAHPEQHSLLSTTAGLIVPGGRFRESYYWDTYWIIKGLLVCNMTSTAQGLVDNLLAFADRYTHVPNGGRVYYLDRSQPPMLTEMVRAVYTALLSAERGGAHALNATPLSNAERKEQGWGRGRGHGRGTSSAAAAWLSRAVPILVREHAFWLRNRTATFTVAPPPSLQSSSSSSSAAAVYQLAHYGQLKRTSIAGRGCRDAFGLPRPESWREDVATAHAAAVAHGRIGGDVYRELVAGAETGWDFSSRWFGDGYNITTINTTSIIPVELNCILLRAELNLHFFQHALGNQHQAEQALTSARKRYAAMEALMWSGDSDSNINSTRSRWVDLDTHTGVQLGNQPTSASDFLPLWAFSTPDAVELLQPNLTRLLHAAAAFNASGLCGVAGVRTTMVKTQQQWDNPNAWAGRNPP